MPQSAASARGLVLDGSLLPASQSAARAPLAFTIQDIPNGLTAGGAAVACRVAERATRGVRGSPADRIREVKKKFELRDHAPAQALGSQRSEMRTSLAGGALLLLGVLDFDVDVLAMSGLPPRRVPAADFPQAFRILTVALVVTPRTVFAPASFAQANPRARPAPSGPTAAFSRNVADAHGRFDLPRESPGRMCNHSPRALSKLE